MYKKEWWVAFFPIQLFWLSGCRHRHGNASTHFHVETPSIQNAAILELLTSLITFRHFYNKEWEDALKSFTPRFFRSLGLIMKKAPLEFFPFIWVKRFLKQKSTAYYAWKVMQKRMSLKHWQQNLASCLAKLCCKVSWKVRLRGLSPTFKPALQQVRCVNTKLWLEDFTLESSTFGRHLVFDVLFYERRDCPLKATINSHSP